MNLRIRAGGGQQHVNPIRAGGGGSKIITLLGLLIQHSDYVVLSPKIYPQTVCWGSIHHIMMTYGEFLPSKISEVGQNSPRQFIDAKFNIQILWF